MRKRIAIDMDEVIANILVKINGLDLPAKADKALIDHHIRMPNFFRDLPVMADSQEIVKRLSEKYEIFIATAAMEFPSSFLNKYQWLEEHFPFIPSSHIVFCGDKSIIHADYLIDDNARHFKAFSGEGILFTSLHNMDVKGYRRVNNWQEVGIMFL
jgi:5'(3')-deoxyribonucleotidase